MTTAEDEHTGFIYGDTSALIALLIALLGSLLTFYNIYMHLSNFSRPKLQKHECRICLMIPIYAITSWVAFRYPESSIWVKTSRDVYEAFVVYYFVGLILEYAGGDSACVQKIELQPPMRQPCPCCWFPPVVMDSRFLRAVKQSVIQFVFVKPIMAFITLGIVVVTGEESHTWAPIEMTIYNLSYTVALYGLVLFYMATKVFLHQYSPMMKFLSVKSIIFLTFWQAMCVDFVPGMTPEEATRWNDFIVCVEMLGFALLNNRAFSYKEFSYEVAIGSASICQNLKELLSLKDIIKDAYNSFNSKTESYMIQSEGTAATEHIALRDVQSEYQAAAAYDMEELRADDDPLARKNLGGDKSPEPDKPKNDESLEDSKDESLGHDASEPEEEEEEDLYLTRDAIAKQQSGIADSIPKTFSVKVQLKPSAPVKAQDFLDSLESVDTGRPKVTVALPDELPAMDLSHIGGDIDEDETEYYRRLKMKQDAIAAGGGSGDINSVLAARLAARGSSSSGTASPGQPWGGQHAVQSPKAWAPQRNQLGGGPGGGTRRMVSRQVATRTTVQPVRIPPPVSAEVPQQPPASIPSVPTQPAPSPKQSGDTVVAVAPVVEPAAVEPVVQSPAGTPAVVVNDPGTVIVEMPSNPPRVAVEMPPVAEIEPASQETVTSSVNEVTAVPAEVAVVVCQSSEPPVPLTNASASTVDASESVDSTAVESSRKAEETTEAQPPLKRFEDDEKFDPFE